MKQRLKVYDASTLYSIEFIGLHILLIFILMYSSSVYFIALDNFSVFNSKLILLSSMIITSLIGCTIRWRRKMTSGGVIVDLVSGLGIYIALAYQKYYSSWIKIIMIICLSIFLIFTVYLLFKRYRGKHIFKIQDADKRNYILKMRLINFGRVYGMIFASAMLILMSPILYNKMFYGGILAVQIKNNDISGFDSDYAENDYGLTKNLDSISKIRFESTWRPLSTNEKLYVLQDIANCETNFFGMEEVTVVLADLGGHTLGSYYDAERRIAIDRRHLENDAPEEILNSCLHEGYHAFQRDLVRLFMNSSESERKLRVFKHCEEYVKEMRNYQDNEKNNFESYMAYYAQYLEMDARLYAADTVKDFYDQIDELLENKKGGEQDE